MIPTHNSYLLLGVAMTQHRQAIIYRKNFKYLKRLIQDGNRIQSGRCRFVEGTKSAWNTPDGRNIELGAVDQDHQVENYQGQGRDFIGIDEAAQFGEYVFRFLTGWLRTDDPNQRTRIILTFNPPNDPEGEWIIAYFAPWLDPDYPNATAVAASAAQGYPRERMMAAKPGELRYFARISDQDIEVDETWRSDPDPMTGQIMRPQSRTFIPGRVTDNPVLMATDYPSQLNLLPEPLRSQLLFGDFSIKAKDDEWQVIGSEDVRAAMKRWKDTPRPDLALRALGVDASRGGDDQTVIASMFGNWVDKLAIYEGKDVPDGFALAKLVEDHIVGGDAVIFLDVVGVGTSPYDILRMRKRRVYGVNFGAGSGKKDRSGTLQFANLRAEAYWRVREMLEPSSDWDICLPDDRQLLIDLTAPRFNADGKYIRIEPKEDVKARIGRSPDRGDAVVMLLWGVYRGVGRALGIV